MEVEGSCVAESELIYVAENGQDSGTCEKSAPCRTIQFAQSLITQQRRVIRILGGLYSVGGTTVAISSTIDGSNTSLVGSARPLFAVAATATLEGVRISSTGAQDTVVSVEAGGTLKLANSTLDRARVLVSAGSIQLSKVKLVSAALECMNGTATISTSVVDGGRFLADNCNAEISSSHLGPADITSGFVGIVSGSGRWLIENNLFVESVAGRPAMTLFGVDVGSSVRFNTIINTALPHSSSAILCPVGTELTSNIISTNSSMPLAPVGECIARHTLFDAAGASAASSGMNNMVGESATFFRSPETDDFRLSPGSPALGMGEPGLVDTDIVGNPRPWPVDTLPDVGAFEAAD